VRNNDNDSYITPTNSFAGVEAMIDDLMADGRKAK
jgi:hypothetical protein